MFKGLKALIYWTTGIIIDFKVSKIFEKAVIIAEDIHRSDDCSKEIHDRNVVERACSIAADVIMQHGLDPKKYHLPSLVGIARVRLGYDDIKWIPVKKT